MNESGCFYMEWVKKYQWAVAAAALCICAGLFLFAVINKNEKPAALPDELTAETAEAPEKDPPAEPQSMVVDVKGAVKNPGVYEIQAGDRVHHAIRQAGGVLDDADQNKLNLALLL
jgi:competence protein ComEA